MLFASFYFKKEKKKKVVLHKKEKTGPYYIVSWMSLSKSLFAFYSKTQCRLIPSRLACLCTTRARSLHLSQITIGPYLILRATPKACIVVLHETRMRHGHKYTKMLNFKKLRYRQNLGIHQ